MYLLLKSYLQDTSIFVIKLFVKKIKGGMSRESTLSPILYTIFNSDFPTADNNIAET